MNEPPIVLSTSNSLIIPLSNAKYLQFALSCRPWFFSSYCLVFHANIIVEILSHVITTASQPGQRDLGCRRSIRCVALGLNYTKDSLVQSGILAWTTCPLFHCTIGIRNIFLPYRTFAVTFACCYRCSDWSSYSCHQNCFFAIPFKVNASKINSIVIFAVQAVHWLVYI